MKDRSKLIAIILVIITITVVIISFIFNKKKSDDIEISIVTNYSEFFTVNSCLNRVINDVVDKNADNLLLVLTDNYKRNNKINKSNVLEIFGAIDDNMTFVTKKMYYEEINDNINKYYVYGYLQKNRIYDEEQIVKLETQDKYFIVFLDRKNGTFSIELYSGDIFMDGDISE